MKHIISMFVALVILWVLLSSHFEPLMLGLGMASVLLTLFIAIRMDVIDHESHPFHLTFHLVKYWILLFWEIIKSNFDVVLRVLGVRPISPTVITLPVPHKTDLGRVIYANSITLTPGTVSIDVKQDCIVVHALSEEGAKELQGGYLASLIPEIEDEESEFS
ncbi:MAG: DNA topoisomerase IV [Gammaproteobacteria bacterium]|nr:MAG: DNA topoisomerase IV [Gammaproteobacteria bacterium]